MRIAVVAPEHVPPVVGGAERLYSGLVGALNSLTKHSAELVSLPSPELSFGQLVDSYSRFLDLDLSSYDQVISTKYPAWMVRHPHHVLYMLHPLRGLYEAYAGPSQLHPPVPSQAQALLHILGSIAPGTSGGARRVLDTARWVVDQLGEDHPACAFPGPLIRDVVRWLDADALDPEHVRRHFAISRTVIDRPGYFPAHVEAVAIPPPSTLGGFEPGPFGAFFTASRLDRPKRIDLLIKALSYVESDIQLRIAGEGPDKARLRSLAQDDPRIVFLGHVDEAQLKAEYSGALAVPFVPYDEEFGLVAVEAQSAGKPVITCTDSGGVTDLVEDGITGLVVDPDAEALAVAFSRLARDPELARTMGSRGTETAKEITWERVIDGLLHGRPSGMPTQPLVPAASTFGHAGVSDGGRPRLVVLSTYHASEARSGGQLRLNRLLRGLAQRFDVDLLALDAYAEAGVSHPMPNVREVIVARGEPFRTYERALRRRAPIPSVDIAAALFVGQCREYLDQLRRAARGASAIVLEHPYLLPAVRLCGIDLPLVYDAHNNEAQLKRAMLGEAPNALNLAAVVEAVEAEAVRSAALVVTCSSAERASLENATPTAGSWALVPNGANVFDTEFVGLADRHQHRERLLASVHERTGKRFNHTAVFVASYHGPNLEAVERILGVATHLPDVAFFVVGGCSAYFAGWTLPRNVMFTGVVSVHLLQALLRSADVALNPMRSGGGTNLKLIEYFASGAPVVSSELGVRGVDARHNEHLLIAEDDDLQEAIKRTLGDPEAAAARAVRARRLAEAGYDWDDLGAKYAEAVAGVVDGTEW